MKKLFLLGVLAAFCLNVEARKKKEEPTTAPAVPAKPANDSGATKKGQKPFDKVITDKAITKKGLFTVHKVDDKWYFEIPDSLIGREFEMTTRYSKTAGGGGVYAGELENEQTLIWEKGPNKNLLLRVVTVISKADSVTDIFKAVKIVIVRRPNYI